MAVLLPESVQNFRTIGLLRNKLWANGILRDLTLSRGASHSAMLNSGHTQESREMH